MVPAGGELLSGLPFVGSIGGHGKARKYRGGKQSIEDPDGLYTDWPWVSSGT